MRIIIPIVIGIALLIFTILKFGIDFGLFLSICMGIVLMMVAFKTSEIVRKKETKMLPNRNKIKSLQKSGSFLFLLGGTILIIPIILYTFWFN